MFPPFLRRRTKISKVWQASRQIIKSELGTFSRTVSDIQYYCLQVNFISGSCFFSSLPSTLSQHFHQLEKIMQTLSEPLPYSSNVSFASSVLPLGIQVKGVIHYDQVVIIKNNLEHMLLCRPRTSYIRGCICCDLYDLMEFI